MSVVLHTNLRSEKHTHLVHKHENQSSGVPGISVFRRRSLAFFCLKPVKNERHRKKRRCDAFKATCQSSDPSHSSASLSEGNKSRALSQEKQICAQWDKSAAGKKPFVSSSFCRGKRRRLLPTLSSSQVPFPVIKLMSLVMEQKSFWRFAPNSWLK